ncbi:MULTISPECIES: DUF6238 family protein [Streptomyces]|uniref:Uncharacterized protein n=1 Tax=Streptomyces stelliscabiei TaxID=146820 RepID=A0A8I0PDY9_9ACTN|nr:MULTISPECIES: DUF6238 family protein [Streptomyces]KND28617.1 hypothetical protein IQ64_43575 [Streptomyces stelliscabiei]MBE1599898.1 hypothetical protein [Streptomyces stelliscabiei]MDX2515932.1 DUF6238 family protein [Streptomyces stelliscabiei]MDX2549518.1 DUF6238 family protein [Streptomyces stelliscabiei]MDX2611540.1 DUF6238 family protein [Streptomyces stelliscabiei]
MTTPRTIEAHPYLRAATAGLRHHTRAHAASVTPADRLHLDTLHAHLTAAHHLLDQLTDTTRPPHPAAGRHLAAAHLRLWQATAAVHDAFHAVPAEDEGTAAEECQPERLPDGPLVLTICQRHLAASHAIRRKATPTDLNAPLHGHTTTCSK